MIAVTVPDKYIIITLVIVKQNKPPRDFGKWNVALQDSKKAGLLSLCFRATSVSYRPWES